MPVSTIDIFKEDVPDIEDAPLPEPGWILEARTGKVNTLGNEPSAIFKKVIDGPVFVSETGLVGDEHAYHQHGGIERAVHQYNPDHYSDWRSEKPPHPELFQHGGFGENLVGTNMNETNVCIGDLYRIGSRVIVQVSEPRSPCSKLNVRFQWPGALKRIQRTGRVGWNYRVLSTGYIQAGDEIALVKRPNPQWSVMNVKRVIQAKSSPPHLLQELVDLEVLTQIYRDRALGKLRTFSKRYELVEAKEVTSRVKQLSFRLMEPVTIRPAEFERFAFAQMEFGPQDNPFKRSYSFLSGDLNQFSLGVSLDDRSRGGSAYLHKELKVGDVIRVAAGRSPKAAEDEEKCIEEDCVRHRIVVIGGIGVTAFIPIIKAWEADGTSYEIHYAVRSIEDAPYVDQLPVDKTTIYAKSRNERLCVEDVIKAQENHKTKVYCCGPSALMAACEHRTKELGYPEHLLHFESFGSNDVPGVRRGEPFQVDVNDPETGRSESLAVSSDVSLLQTLRDAGFDMTYFCEEGGCGVCKVKLLAGNVIHSNSGGLKGSEKTTAMLTCVDRGSGPIKIELE